MEDARDNKIYVDENGESWLTNENGQLLKDERGNNIPPMYSTKKDDDFGYDNSRGHCFFCGSLTCSGNCFK